MNTDAAAYHARKWYRKKSRGPRVNTANKLYWHIQYSNQQKKRVGSKQGRSDDSVAATRSDGDWLAVLIGMRWTCILGREVGWAAQARDRCKCPWRRAGGLNYWCSDGCCMSIFFGCFFFYCCRFCSQGRTRCGGQSLSQNINRRHLCAFRSFACCSRSSNCSRCPKLSHGIAFSL